MVPCYYFFFTAAALIEWWKKGSDRPCVGKYLHLYFEALRLFFLTYRQHRELWPFVFSLTKIALSLPFHSLTFHPMWCAAFFFLPLFNPSCPSSRYTSSTSQSVCSRTLSSLCSYSRQSSLAMELEHLPNEILHHICLFVCISTALALIIHNHSSFYMQTVLAMSRFDMILPWPLLLEPDEPNTVLECRTNILQKSYRTLGCWTERWPRGGSFGAA